MEEEVRIHKCLILGNSGVGKTSFMNMLITGQYPQEHDPTLGVEVHPVPLRDADGNLHNFNCWELAGDERFRGGNYRDFYRGADCAVIMYDDQSTVHSVDYWLTQIWAFADYGNSVIVKNKCDMEDQPVDDGAENDEIHISVQNQMNLNAPFESLIKQFPN